MKKIAILIGALLMLNSCSSIRYVESWKNEEVLFFKPQKLLVVGMTDNLTGRKLFEERLTSELRTRNINTYISSPFLDETFTAKEQAEEDINDMVSSLKQKGFDAIIISAVRGVDDRQNYTRGFYTVNYHWRRFGRYYFRYQDIYYTPGYYNKYSIYHIETAIYNINEDESKSLVWVGSFDIVDPRDISTTVNAYVTKIIEQLEKDGVITPL